MEKDEEDENTISIEELTKEVGDVEMPLINEKEEEEIDEVDSLDDLEFPESDLEEGDLL